MVFLCTSFVVAIRGVHWSRPRDRGKAVQRGGGGRGVQIPGAWVTKGARGLGQQIIMQF